MVHTYYFSASNTTEKIVKAVADNLGQEVLHHNLTPSRIARIVNPAKDDIVIFAAPVYAGRIPVVSPANRGTHIISAFSQKNNNI